MKYENVLKTTTAQETLRNALIDWCLGSDGNDGGTCDVLDAIPWTTDMDKTLPWDKIYRKVDEAIGARIKVGSEVVTNSYRREEFLREIDKKVENIVNVYQDAIDEMNKKNSYCMMI